MTYSLYAIKYEYGIKIGGTSNIDERLKSYKSSGGSFTVFHTVTVPDKKFEVNLKEVMSNLNLIVSVPQNDQATEVYDLTPNQAVTLMNILSKGEQLTNRIVKTIIYGDTQTLATMTYLEINHMYGSKIKKPIFQREIDQEHVDNLQKYIEDTYYKPHYYLPPIVLVKENDKTEAKYIVIDGLHRCAAIHNINKNQLCMKMKLPVYIYENLPMSDQLQLFRDINKSRPVPQIYLVDKYYDKMRVHLSNMITKKYGDESVEKWDEKNPEYKSQKTILTYAIQLDTFNTLLTNDTFNILLENKHINDIDNNSIFKFIEQVNIDLSFAFKHLLGIDNLYEFTLSSPKINKILEYIRLLNKSNKILSPKSLEKFIMTCIQNTEDHNRNHNRNCTTKKPKNEPFMLGLIYKTDLYSAYNFINTSDERFIVWE